MSGSSDDLIQNYKLKIKSKYNLMDLGPINWLLSIKITWDCENCTISLFQSSYIESLLRQFKFTDLSQHLWTQIFGIWRTSAYRHQNKLQKCTISLTVKLLACSYTSLLPHALILHSQSEYSHNSWIIQDGFIGKEWNTYFSIWPVQGIGF